MTISYSESETLLRSLADKGTLNRQFFAIFLVISSKSFCEGYTVILAVLISPFIETTLPRPTAEFILRSSFAIGTTISGILVELIKRSSPKFSIIILSFSAVMSSAAYLISNSVVVIAFSNLMIGVCFGSMLSISCSMAVELINKPLRSIIFTWVWISYPLGGLLACFVSETEDLINHPENIQKSTFLITCMVKL